MCGSLSSDPPLTVDNIVKELKEVMNVFKLYLWFSGDASILASIEDVVEQFLQGHGYYQPSWRAVIFALDGAGETRVADRIRHYAEPVRGRYIYMHVL